MLWREKRITIVPTAVICTSLLNSALNKNIVENWKALHSFCLWKAQAPMEEEVHHTYSPIPVNDLNISTHQTKNQKHEGKYWFVNLVYTVQRSKGSMNKDQSVCVWGGSECHTLATWSFSRFGMASSEPLCSAAEKRGWINETIYWDVCSFHPRQPFISAPLSAFREGGFLEKTNLCCRYVPLVVVIKALHSSCTTTRTSTVFAKLSLQNSFYILELSHSQEFFCYFIRH